MYVFSQKLMYSLPKKALLEIKEIKHKPKINHVPCAKYMLKKYHPFLLQLWQQ